MNKLKIALLQIEPEENIQDNLLKGIKYCHMAKEKNADIILFPEMFSNGYNLTLDYETLYQQSITINDPFIQTFKKLSKELDIAIGITYLERYKNKMRNSICLFDRFGNLMFNYAKVHTCDFGYEKVLQRGKNFYVADLNTKIGNIKVGSMICYDREFPESARILMLKGAELILVPNACPMEINRISQLRGRAYENMLAIATVNYPKTVPDCNGHSTVFDGVVYHESFSGSRDTLLFEANEEEGMYIVDIDIDLLADLTHGFNGADISNFLDKAVEISAIRNISSPTKDLVMEDFNKSLEKVSSSVQIDDIVKLDEWRKENNF